MPCRIWRIRSCNVIRECDIKNEEVPEQLNFFEDFEEKERKKAELEESLDRERRMQDALIEIKHKQHLLSGMDDIGVLGMKVN